MRFQPTFALLAGIALAKPYAPPCATEAVEELSDSGLSPIPTNAPNLELVKRRLAHSEQLQKRGANSQIIGYEADLTCGYVSGMLAASLTCDAGYACGIIASADGIPALQGCCNTETCLGFWTTCVGRAQSANCNAACQANTLNLLCTDLTEPYCITATWPEFDAVQYGCDSTPVNTLIDVYTEVGGNQDAILYTPVYDTSSGGTTTPPFQSHDTVTVTAPANTQPPSSTKTPTPTPAPKKSTPVGAIVGGVVGGLALIGAFVAAAFFLCLRSKRNSQSNQPNNNNNQAVPPPMPPPTGQLQVPMVDNRYSAVPPEYGQQQQYYQKGPYSAVSPTSPVPAYSPPSNPATPQPVAPQHYQYVAPHPQGAAYPQGPTYPQGAPAPYPQGASHPQGAAPAGVDPHVPAQGVYEVA